MRFFHIADVHLGAQPDAGFSWSENRGREIWDSFRNVIRQAGREHAGLFLIAGDLFHRQPLMKELKEVNYLFSTIPDTKIVLIAGNHDYMRETSAYRKMKWADNVYWLFENQMSYVEFPELQTAVYGFSYDRKEILEPRYDHVPADSSMPIQILLAHGGDEKHIPFTRSTFANTKFNYIALGHIHKPQVLIEDKAAYAGALEPIDKNDTGVHGYIKGECTKDGTQTTFVPSALREYKNLKINVSEKTTQFSLEETLRAAILKRGQNHLYHIILEGKRAPETEFVEERLYALGNVREVEDRTMRAYSVEYLKTQYADSILSEFIRRFPDEGRSLQEEKILQYGIEALLLSGEDMS